MNFPIEFLIRGEIPALKNNRTPIIGKAGNIVNRPNKEVEQFIQKAKDTFNRQLPEGFEIIKEPQEVFLMMEIGVFYKSDLPKSDLDNSYTTLQEALFTAKTLMGPVLQDDRQVCGFFPIRKKMVLSPELTYTKIWIWPGDAAETAFKNCLLTFTEMYGKVAKTT